MLETAYQISTSPLEYNEIIVKFKYEYNCILGCQVNNSLLKLKQKQPELGDKPQKLLAQQLKSSQATGSIYRIKSYSGVFLPNPKDINNRFKHNTNPWIKLCISGVSCLSRRCQRQAYCSYLTIHNPLTHVVRLLHPIISFI